MLSRGEKQLDKIIILAMILAFGVALPKCDSAELRFKEDFLSRLVAWVPEILKQQDPETGRFGTGVWIVNDQEVMFPLAVAWSYKSPQNPYYRDSRVLDAIVKAGDALIADMKPDGRWEFRKKDGSTWGDIYMPWTYAAWIKTYSLIRQSISEKQRKRWDEALIHGFSGISENSLKRVHNIPTNHAMALYIAGQVFQRPQWCDQAKSFMARVVAEQDPAGFWSENHGPVIGYGYVYTDALGIYYAVSHDESVLPAIEKAVRFYSMFTYPDGSSVETVDERNPYHAGVRFPNTAFTLTPEGRRHVLRQIQRVNSHGGKISPDFCANYLLYGEEGVVEEQPDENDFVFRLDDGKALIQRKGPWFICLSAYHCPINQSRWIQDRQNFLSIFHERCGLVLGGGNTKLQPLWSTFTVGNVSLLKHTPGDENPTFVPADGLFHVPSSVGIGKTDPPKLALVYGPEKCSLEVQIKDSNTVNIRLTATHKSGMPVAAHLTFIPHVGKPVSTQNMAEITLGEDEINISAEEAGGWIAHGGWTVSLPPGSSVLWPVLPHNPYRKDGHATVQEGRIVVSIPFSSKENEHVVTIKVLP